jgi:L-seryl-tRNA(Ser) seleniumtransferase
LSSVTQPVLRAIPSVDFLLQSDGGLRLVEIYGHSLTLQAIRETLAQVRDGLSAAGSVPPTDAILAGAESRLAEWTRPGLGPVINATGVILHTNLGRAPLSRAAVEAMRAASAYVPLEFDLGTGKRGRRAGGVEQLLQRLTGAESALVVNNNAAAVLLVLAALAARRRVVIARSQLVEIGGGFRVPEVMKQSGAKLAEIGTTNKVRLRDYEEALNAPAALVLHAHRSNFKLIGFTEEPELDEIAAVAHRYGLPLVDDLGSGTLLDTAKYGLGHEPTVGESLAAGSDVVCFSGDKLLGGPQAGIIVGRADLLARIRKHPLARAVRADKASLAGLAATLLHYLKDEAEREIPIWQMISASVETLEARAERWRVEIGSGEVVPAESTVGGGSLPGEVLPTRVLSLAVPHPDRALAALRRASVPVIARTEKDRVLLDPRTVSPDQDAELLSAIAEALGASSRREPRE